MDACVGSEAKPDVWKPSRVSNICVILSYLVLRLPRIISVMFVAFVGRGLSSMPEGIFCYSAIVTTGVVKLLPKYLIICSSLELASKQSTSTVF